MRENYLELDLELIATSRREAFLLNLLFYVGKPCPACASEVRYTSNSGCVACTRAAAAARHRDKQELKALREEEARSEVQFGTRTLISV